MPLRRAGSLLLLLGILFPLLSATTTGSSALAQQTTFASNQFEQVWQRADLPVARNAAARSWLWGPVPGEVRTEPWNGGSRTVQYFDKARMEPNPAADPGTQWATTTGLLVSEMVLGRIQLGADSYQPQAPADIPVAGDAIVAPELASGVPLYSSFRNIGQAEAADGATVLATIDRAGNIGALASSTVRYSAYSKETGHNIPDVFERYMMSRGTVYEGGQMQDGALLDPVYVLGHPISEAYWATVPVGGKPERVLIQLYQRRVLTYIPSYDPAWQVQMGNVGRHYFAWRYETPQPTAVPTAPAVPGANDSFLHVVGNQFYYRGAPVKLKGTNYWLNKKPFVGTWVYWNGYAVYDELIKAKELGVNSIRIGLPYDNSQATEAVWGPGCETGDLTCTEVKGSITHYMAQLLQIAAGYDMKVLFVLFDWDDDFPVKGTAEYNRQVSYLRGIVGPFVDDDRVIGWDLHNEPENYGPWSDEGGPAKVIGWLDNIATELRAIDSRHPLTVGMGNYENLWLAPNGKSILDFVDFVSFHCYNAGHLRTEIDAIAARTSKPILLEEMGWPTGPAKLSNRDHIYDDNEQEFFYRITLADTKASSLVGFMQWTLQDFPAVPKDRYAPTVETWFGLVRRDGTYKPAAALFRDYIVVPPLPSDTKSALRLTGEGERP